MWAVAMPMQTAARSSAAPVPSSALSRKETPEAYRLPAGRTHAYGTSGFRMAAGRMAPVAYACGALAALLSGHGRYGAGRVVGAALTASHNPAEDNGIKFVAPDGSLFPPALEALAERAANAADLGDLPALVDEALSDPCFDAGSAGHDSTGEKASPTKVRRVSAPITPPSAHPARVLVARDTRESGPALEDAFVAGARAAVPGVVVLRYGLATTPEAHVAVRELNARPHLAGASRGGASIGGANGASGQCTPPETERKTNESAQGEPRDGCETLKMEYVQKLADAYERALGGERHAAVLTVDAAHGVGAARAAALAPLVAHTGLEVVVVNAGDGTLNHACGADWVKTRSAPPAGLDEGVLQPDGPGKPRHFASLDGDADRVVFFEPRAEPFVLLDGDRIAALAARTLRVLLDAVRDAGGPELNLAAVQTAYANGASSDYLAGPDVRAPPVFACTGVKHLHAAAETHDVAVYFEANGHGTLLLHKRARQALTAYASESGSDAKGRDAAKQILALADLANPLVGDALADALLVEATLHIARMDVRAWAALYAERPSCLLKVAVPDRAAYRTADADRRVLEPADVQPAVDALVAGVPGSRAFVRPSGTEDYLRVFAEAPAQIDADRLAMAVVDFVKARAPSS